ncbi:amidase family protein [Mangrovicoccus ximenensis]|uniref:amidase family protein n=1 Tax=Mangrovicoccus ximenensis TaxID=1911570 RepID=UPI001EEDA0F2|nr:amidase family protein [Mangrovicoccus ximenensis]
MHRVRVFQPHAVAAALRKGAAAADAALASGAELGPLHGLPFGVKDMIDVAGLPTTFGSELFRNNIATKDDAIVAAMRGAGAIPMGKTNNPEWSAGGNTRNRVYGATANPHDLTRTCAGSSGGSAAALAAGYFPLATGSDTGGSLRNPAAPAPAARPAPPDGRGRDGRPAAPLPCRRAVPPPPGRPAPAG